MSCAHATLTGDVRATLAAIAVGAAEEVKEAAGHALQVLSHAVAVPAEVVSHRVVEPLVNEVQHLLHLQGHLRGASSSSGAAAAAAGAEGAAAEQRQPLLEAHGDVKHVGMGAEEAVIAGDAGRLADGTAAQAQAAGGGGGGEDRRRTGGLGHLAHDVELAPVGP